MSEAADLEADLVIAMQPVIRDALESGMSHVHIAGALQLMGALLISEMLTQIRPFTTDPTEH